MFCLRTQLTTLRRLFIPKCTSHLMSTLPLSDSEQKLVDVLKKGFPNAVEIDVKDISGGCGAMYEISVVSGEFSGLSLVKQHQLVNSVLKQEIKDMHGLRIQTRLPIHWSCEESEYNNKSK